MAESEIPDGFLYTREHHWVKIEDGAVVFGITDHAQNQLGDVVFVELPQDEIECHAADEIGMIESLKTTSEIYAPVSGTVVEVNRKLESNPELLNHDPYGRGWIARITASDPGELSELLRPQHYGHVLEEGE